MYEYITRTDLATVKGSVILGMSFSKAMDILEDLNEQRRREAEASAQNQRIKQLEKAVRKLKNRHNKK